MSAAGTPSTDPWVILARERARYEEQFKTLKPNNGIITGEQAKGFFLQSQLPPLILGQIWSLADTDSDGKMDINEFSIACKLINLKLRGYEIPKGIPPSLLASLKVHTPPAIPPLPTLAAKTVGVPPPRPEPPKAAPMINSQPLMQTASMLPSQPLLPQVTPTQPLVAGLVGIPSTTGMVPPPVAGIPTGIVPPMQANIRTNQTLISGIPSMQPTNFTAPIPSAVPPLSATMTMPLVSSAPLIPGMPPVGAVPPLSSVAPMPAVPPISAVPPMQSVAPLNGENVAPLPPLSTVTPVGAVVPGSMSPVGSQITAIAGPGATSTPRTSVTSLDRGQSMESMSQPEWAVPHQTKLKYTQIFNTTDRTRSGFLSGAQARNLMVQTKLPQNILAQIWALADMDADGRLGCEEFVLAMHLCDQASLGHSPPTKLPLDLIPPSFRRTTRTASVSSQGSVTVDQDPASTLLQQNSFEDKRKENFEKGQAELERRRKTLLDQQRQEREERERKEREELEKKEKARQEAERKRLEELEKQMREQQEKERQVEEERKRQAEQREAARKEMERQRQLEWEKQRLQELQQQRQREQENVLKLKAKNQTLTIELTTLNDQVKGFSQKICDTRLGVSNVKATIDGMRSTRDTQMQEMSQLKSKLKEQNARLLALSQEKIKLDAKNKLNAQDSEQARVAFESKEVNIKNLKQKIDDMQTEIDGKLSDIENNNSQLKELQNEMKTLVSECENLYIVYEQKRNTVLEMKNANKGAELDAWKTTDAWGDSGAADWPVDNWAANAPDATNETAAVGDFIKYRAIYEFVARTNDEISFQPGDIISVPTEQTGEPGWLAGEIRGKTGWFPESYVEPIDGVGVRDNIYSEPVYAETTEAQRLEGIAEVPEGTDTTNSIEAVPAQVIDDTTEPEGDAEYYIANYTYISKEPGDLTFNAGEVVTVLKKEGDWWTGKIRNNVGIFPSNYVQKVDVNSAAATNTAPATEPASIEPPTGVSAEAVKSALENSSMQADNEVSQINQSKPKYVETPLESAMQSNAQAVKVKKPEIAQVIAPYESTSPEQLSLARGQLIMIRKKADSGWWEGELQAKGRKRQVGWFPANYVKVLNSSGRTSGRTTPVSTSRMQQEIVIDKVIALYPYTALNPDELTFEKDDIISVTAREEESWWRGELNGVCGLFPSNYVTPLTQQFYSPVTTVPDPKRLESIKEFIQTERTYVKDMSVVREVFEIPIRQSKLISTREIDDIFVNWQDIIQCNKNFLRELMKSYDAGRDMVGDIICRHLPRMTAYITFCKKQLESTALLQNLTENSTALRDLLKKCQRNVAIKGMPLSSFLIKPMQRITRYPLFISKILENTPPDHPDYSYLEEALKVAEKFLNCVNENVRLKENQDRLDWLQQCVQNDLSIVFNSITNKLGPRQLLHHSMLKKLKTNKELIGFLFNDFFLLVQPSKSVGTQFSFQRNTNVTYKMYKQPIFIQYLVISRDSTDHVEHGTDSNRVVNVQDEKTTYKIALLATTVHECSLLTKRIQSAKEAYNKIAALNQQNRRKTYPQLGPICGRLFVFVQKGKRFITSGKAHSENIYVKVTLGSQEQDTDLAKETLTNGNAVQNGAPPIPFLVWNYNMQFQLRNVNQEILSFVVYEQNLFSPDEFLGRAEIKLSDIYRESQNHIGPITKKLILHQVESGELIVKVDLQVFNNY